MFKSILSACVVGTCLLGAVAHAQTLPEPMRFARQMGIGTNLGNTLEATGFDGKTVRDFETGWGNPVTTKEMIAHMKAAGFKTLRIPVGWSNLMQPGYRVHPDLMNRVADVVGYALDNDMYVIVNIHWDGGWFKKFPTDYDECMKKYKTIWTQISERFKDYPEKLIFESLNEEARFEEVKERGYEIANKINQEFTNVVRGSGGNNSSRYLLIAGYGTDIDATVKDTFKMPDDPAGRCMISVHYYTPSTFTILEKDADWGKVAMTWGTPEEVAAVKTDMAKMKKFSDRGIPVVVGEFGCPDKKDPTSVVKYLSTVCETAYQMGYVPVMWDTGNFFDRRTGKFRNPEIGEAFNRIAATPRP